MGLCVLYYVKYSLYNVKKVGFFYLGWNYTLRYGILPIRIETGCYIGKIVSDRLCVFCNENVIENESLFIASCSFYQDLQAQVFGEIFNRLPILDSSKLKECADDNFKFDKYGRKLPKWVENTALS